MKTNTRMKYFIKSLQNNVVNFVKDAFKMNVQSFSDASER
jgi:hypothetical protein